jgi:hypothetical protein
MPRKVFVAGEILTAADVNTNLMDQAVMVFDDDTARGSAIPSPSEGMVTYLKDTDELEKYTTDWEPVNTQGILQVVSTAKTDTFSTSSTTFTALTGLSASITPSSTNSKILIICLVSYGTSSRVGYPKIRFMRDSTAVGVGASVGSRLQATTGLDTEAPSDGAAAGIHGSAFGSFLDSPSSTSSITYSVEIGTTAGTVLVNRSSTDTDNGTIANARTISSITLMEVAG